ncbi:ATP-binding cassette domain-containing protein [Sphingomonas sp. Ag1]|jgi:molybdate transport system ATP-binding protein|uniref:ATP-binding cassette domain-containing protein n=1 Tax=Sphingomonas sp. Ag1 TaxID=1642949 RepID=UPI00062147E0|nr:ATP-binding cassette domain-containing protein [Sphingomonas sp. Ag1]KKI17437.1 molybdenum ABC transporter ATP-binding protein [Sphingomonas sp. Ag1]
MSFDIDLTVRRGERVIGTAFRSDARSTVLVGPSGAGKTSVLMMIAGLLAPSVGHVRVGGRTLYDAAARIDVPPHRRRAGVVFQEPRLFPHLSVRRNLLYGASDALALPRIAATLEVEPLLERWPRSLSGGEARRVAIGRALLSAPDFLLLDEPLASLDRARREEAMQEIERLRDDLRLPMLIVTHDPEEAERLGQHIIRM